MALAPKRPKGRASNIVPGKAEGTWDVNVQLLMPRGKRWTVRRKGLKTKVMGRASSAGAALESWLKHCIDQLWPVEEGPSMAAAVFENRHMVCHGFDGGRLTARRE